MHIQKLKILKNKDKTKIGILFPVRREGMLIISWNLGTCAFLLLKMKVFNFALDDSPKKPGAY